MCLCPVPQPDAQNGRRRTLKPGSGARSEGRSLQSAELVALPFEVGFSMQVVKVTGCEAAASAVKLCPSCYFLPAGKSQGAAAHPVTVRAGSVELAVARRCNEQEGV